MNKLSALVVYFLFCITFTHCLATDSLFVQRYDAIQWHDYRDRPVSELLQEVYTATGQDWKIYKWQYPTLKFVFPYSEDEDLQVEVSVKVPAYYQWSLSYWETDSLTQAIILSVEQPVMIPRMTRQAVNDYLCLMAVNRDLHERVPKCRSQVPLALGEDPERLDPVIMEHIRESCQRLFRKE